MGRSNRSQADENRARILQVVSGLFRAHGVEAVGIADVMKAAGMTQGGFYKHFPSKGSARFRGRRRELAWGGPGCGDGRQERRNERSCRLSYIDRAINSRLNSP